MGWTALEVSLIATCPAHGGYQKVSGLSHLCRILSNNLGHDVCNTHQEAVCFKGKKRGLAFRSSCREQNLLWPYFQNRAAVAFKSSNTRTFFCTCDATNLLFILLYRNMSYFRFLPNFFSETLPCTWYPWTDLKVCLPFGTKSTTTKTYLILIIF
jgi:hypothetical protein